MAAGVIIPARGLENAVDIRRDGEASGRIREVWPASDFQKFTRLAKVVRQHGDKLLLRCGADLCRDQVIRLEADGSAERGAVLRCGCTDRVIGRSF
jgi:hypothetical protein